ncbi:protein quiver-like protein, partial [Dinothrombium tinctorium]
QAKVLCFECISTITPECNDPFNQSIRENQLLPLSDCEGCCVKIVRYRNTKNQYIRRTCTSNLQINLFMVDHVCIEESNGQ